jgi:hypothetical protein
MNCKADESDCGAEGSMHHLSFASSIVYGCLRGDQRDWQPICWNVCYRYIGLELRRRLTVAVEYRVGRRAGH